MTARVTFFNNDAPARELILDDERSYLVGRSPDCEICLDDAELSRTHARLRIDRGSWRITDLDSKNGIYVSGKGARQAKLSNGTWIGVGSMLMRFETLNREQVRRAGTQQDKLREMTQQGHARIDAATDVAEVLRQLLASVIQISGTQRGFALLTRPDGDLEVACSTGVQRCASSDDVFQGSRGAVRQVLDSRRSVVTCDARTHAALANRESVISAQTGALTCLPLAVLDRVVGIIYADTTRPGKFFTELDLQLLEELADHAALTIAAAQLGAELDAIDKHQDPREALVAKLTRVGHRIPDVNRKLSNGNAAQLTGVFWSGIEART